MDEALDVLAADQRQIFAEFLPVEVVEHGAVVHLLLGHLVEHLGGGGELLAQALGEAAVDAAVLFLVGDGERQHFLLGQIGKSFHGAPLKSSAGGRFDILELFQRRKRGMPLQRLRRALEPLITRLMHFYWRFSRPATLGARAMVIDGEGRVFLVSTPTSTAGTCPAAAWRPARPS